jgi:hypothetical protein
MTSSIGLLELEKTWEELCDQLRAFGMEALRSEQPLDRIEGIRHALRFLGHMTDNNIEFADPLRPEFRRICTPTRKFYGDGVDVDYLQARIDPTQTYRICGTRGTAPHLSVIVYRTGLSDRIAGNIVDDAFEVRPDGTFELWLGPGQLPGPGIQLDDRCFEVVLRQYHKDRQSEQDGSFRIELVGDDPGPRSELDAQWLAKALSMCTKGLKIAPRRLADLRARLIGQPNTLLDSAKIGLTEMFFGTASNKYLIGWYQLGPEEALELELPRVPAAYVGVQLYNRWFESFEFRDRVTSLNDRQLVYRNDGKALVTIGGQPGAVNWIDTCGHREGIIVIRFLETTHDLPEVACTQRVGEGRSE